MSESKLDVLAIGDVVTDAFIKLFDDKALVMEDENGPKLVMPFATKLPFEKAIILEGVGNAGNASVAFARLGLKSGLISNVGEDDYGRNIIRALKKQKVDTRFLHINNDKASNYHYVLWYKDERTILIKHEEYEYSWPKFRASDIPRWVYFSSISKNALNYHNQVADWLEDHPEVKLAFQPGTFQMEAGIEKMKRIYARSEVLVLNREEASLVTGGEKEDLHNLFDRMHHLGPKIAVITDGPDGAYASDGENRFAMPNYPDPAPPLERTGAGDSFASTFVAALMHGATIEAALLWAPINSMSVVQKIGAQAGLLGVKDIEKYLHNAPDWYHPTRI